LRRHSTSLRQTRDEIDRVRKQIEGIKGLVETKSNWIVFFKDLQERLVKVEDVWLEKLEVLRPQGTVQTSALAGSLFGGLSAKPAAPGSESQTLRLNLAGRLLDKNNPLSKVSFESQQRVKTLLSSFTESEFIVRLEGEHFDNSQPGVLKFDFVLVVDPKHPL
jgi:type IV pilus assembly protein PilM